MEFAAVRVGLSANLCAAHAAGVVILGATRQDQEESLAHWVRLFAATAEDTCRFKLAEAVCHAVILADDWPMSISRALDRLSRRD